MLKIFLLLMATIATSSATAQVVKCQGSDGKVQFSDTPCQAGSRSEPVPDRAPVTRQQHEEALQRARQMQNEAAAAHEESANRQTAQAVQQQRRDADAERKAATDRGAPDDSDAISACVRDVERHGASAKVKAEMIAACRTARPAQSASGASGEALATCVKNVERTGASEKDKTRQLATCHGADVQPEFLPPPGRKTVPVPRSASD